MKIMTYNVQSGRDAWGQLHLEDTADTIKRISPDICALNEIRVGCSDSLGINQAEFLAENTGMNYRFAKAIPLGDGEYGIAILSKWSISEFDVYPVPDVPINEREEGYYENRVIYRAVIDTPEGKTAVLGSHFGLTTPERAYAVKLLSELIENETLPIVFMGDLNMEPDDTLIKQIENKLTNISGNKYFTHHTLSLKGTIDYIFARGLECSEVKTKYSFASDHLPVIAEMRIAYKN